VWTADAPAAAGGGGGGAAAAPSKGLMGAARGRISAAPSAASSMISGPPDLAANGSLEVRVVSASNLMAKDRGGTSDPFVSLELAGTKHRSQTIMQTLNPPWDERFAFKGTLGKLVAKPLVFKCYDYDKMAMNDRRRRRRPSTSLALPAIASRRGAPHLPPAARSLGEISFSLEPLKLKPDVRGADFPLGKAKSGSITFEIKWTPAEQR
jgi:hypothetical protein